MISEGLPALIPHNSDNKTIAIKLPPANEYAKDIAGPYFSITYRDARCPICRTVHDKAGLIPAKFPQNYLTSLIFNSKKEMLLFATPLDNASRGHDSEGNNIQEPKYWSEGVSEQIRPEVIGSLVKLESLCDIKKASLIL